MLKPLLAAACILLLASSGMGHGNADPAIRWQTAPAHGGKQTQLTIRSQWGGRDRSSWSDSLSDFQVRGLSSAQLQSASARRVNFVVGREAGRLDCSGTVERGHGHGDCRFVADPSFASFLAAAAIGRPSARQSFDLTLANVGRELVRAVADRGLPNPSLEDLVAMGIHEVTPDYVREIAVSGIRVASAEDLVALRIHDVTPTYVRAIASAAPQLRTLTAAEIVEFRIHDVRPALISAFVGAHRISDVDDIVALAVDDVSPEFIQAMAGLGYRNLGADQLVQMKTFGVTPEFARAAQAARNRQPSVDQLVELRQFGGERR